MLEAAKKLLFILIAELPLIAGIMDQWSGFIHNHPIVSGLLAIAYQALVLLSIIVRKLWKEIEKDLIKSINKWIKNTVFSFSTSFKKRYTTQIKFDHRVFNVRGLKTQGTYTLMVEDVFVELRVAPSHLQQTTMNPLAFKELTGSQPIWSFLRRLKVNQDTALAIVGPPGSGKTSLLQHVALTLTRKRNKQIHLPALFPVLLFLREHVKLIVEHSPNIAELAQSYFSDPKRYPSLRPPKGWFSKQLEAGRCLVLLDGLDEVAGTHQRRIVSQWVDDQIRNFPNCCFLVTARPNGYKDAPLAQAHVLEVMPFNHQQVSAFIHNWYLANKILSYGRNDLGVCQDAQRESQDLLRRLRAQPSLKAMSINPLLLTMIATVHNHRGVLPGHRVELYSEICDVFLSHWQQAKKINDTLTAAQKRSILQPLAAYMMNRNSELDRRTVTIQEIRSVVSTHLREIGVPEDNLPSFLYEIQEKSGILLEKEPGVWSFAHFTFQEYLCAAHWNQTKETDAWDSYQWKHLIRESFWHETLRLYASQGNASPLAAACLEVNTVGSLTLAADLLEEAMRLDASIRDRIEVCLNENLESTNPSLQRLAAEVLLMRHLKTSFRSIDEEREVDSCFVNCAEYQLFLDDMRSQGKHCQPDHWVDYRFSPGQSRVALAGIRFEDAKSFCVWLTERYGHTYRLPRADEVAEISVGEGNVFGFWGEDGKLFGFSAEDESAIKERLKDEAEMPMEIVVADIGFHFHSSVAPILQDIDSLGNSLNRITIDYGLPSAILYARQIERASVLNRASNVAYDLANDIDRYIDENFEPTLYIDRAHELAHLLHLDLRHDIHIAQSICRAQDLFRIAARARDLVDLIGYLHYHQSSKTQFIIDAFTRSLETPPRIPLQFPRAHVLSTCCHIISAIDLQPCGSYGDLRHAYNPSRDGHLIRARDLAQYLTRALDTDLVLDKVYASDFARDLAYNLMSDCDVILASAYRLDFQYSSHNPSSRVAIVEAIKCDNYSEAIDLINKYIECYHPISNEANALKLALEICGARNTSVVLRKIYRELAISKLKRAYRTIVKRSKTGYNSWLPWSRKPVSSEKLEKDKYLIAYWYLKLVLKREAAEIPAWEGIRLVRELKVAPIRNDLSRPPKSTDILFNDLNSSGDEDIIDLDSIIDLDAG